MKIAVTTAATAEDAARLSRGIVEYNHSALPDLEPEDAEVRFFVLARDASGQLQGGIRASCYWNTLHIELLWLSATCRGQGTGRQLLKAAEDFAVEKGMEKAMVETTSWQAKPFYEKCGYQHVATLPDRPKGHASHYLHKTL
ncbi:GNAT family N-acetyltransferase [Gallaecimonas mangrovi]|uniref:GNAT family N-acetyltransferase n=1 Tax=Gallaecimonas mangrovi TaxID=2291597 RepID=UPI000E20C48F|nr:GNAT family N-acetyltransferase [Gallaecimonas mangrovi]